MSVIDNNIQEVVVIGRGTLSAPNDFQEYIHKRKVVYHNPNAYAYNYYDDDYYDDYDDYYNDYASWWKNTLGNDSHDPMGEDDTLMNNCQVWPPMDEEERRYYRGIMSKDFPIKKKRVTKKGTLRPQRFINGMEVDDDEFEAYNAMMGKTKKVTRRGGKKHKNKKNSLVNKREVRYKSMNHQRPLDSCRGSVYADEEKKIIFYRDLKNTADTYEWDSLHEFNQWLDEEGIQVDDRDISGLLYRVETHCCLDPATDRLVLVCERSYGDLVYTVTGGDEDLLSQYSESVTHMV